MTVQYNSRVTIQKKERGKKDKRRICRWVDYFFCPARIIPENEIVGTDAGTTENPDGINVTVKLSPETKCIKRGEYRIRYNDRLYDILAADTYGLTNRQITFACKITER